MPKHGKMPYLGRDKYGRNVPGYPAKTSSGSTTPAGYQKEARAHRKSSAGSRTPTKKSSKM